MIGEDADAAASASCDFDYVTAFSRNLGLVSAQEQARLRSAKVAIAGLGGVGGIHAVTLARMGIGNFHIADFDIFEIQNFNRQFGAAVSTIGQPKADVLRRHLLDINPSATVATFSDGISEENIDAFLDGVDVAIDGLDFFAVAARQVFYARTHARGIPVVAAGPIGCSAALLVFLPGGMSWHDYFAMDLAKTEVDKYVLFAIGTAPRGTHFSYLDSSQVDLAAHRGPSLALAVQLCAGVVGAETLKLLLKRGTVLAVPAFQQFDAYRSKYVSGRLRWGNRGPLQRLKLAVVRKRLVKQSSKKADKSS